MKCYHVNPTEIIPYLDLFKNLESLEIKIPCRELLFITIFCCFEFRCFYSLSFSNPDKVQITETDTLHGKAFFFLIKRLFLRSRNDPLF